jgi:hypothetical protein
MGILITFCKNVAILFLNGLISIKYLLISLPYFQIITIAVCVFFVFRLLAYEAEQIKAPHIKITRRRI